jgi:hypothetical protein
MALLNVSRRKAKIKIFLDLAGRALRAPTFKRPTSIMHGQGVGIEGEGCRGLKYPPGAGRKPSFAVMSCDTFQIRLRQTCKLNSE